MHQALQIQRRRFRRLSIIALTLVGLGCAGRTPIEAPTTIESPFPTPEPAPYRLQVGDEISIKFWGNPELDEDMTIRPDRRISLPFIDEVTAAGRTPAELDAELTRLYEPELTKPEITVIVRSFAGQRIFIGGEVGAQGTYPLVGNVTLAQAIQEAGGFLPTARRREVLLIRTAPQGVRIARSHDLLPLLRGENPAADVTLQPFDIVFVPRTKITNFGIFVDQYVNAIIPEVFWRGYYLADRDAR